MTTLPPIAGDLTVADIVGLGREAVRVVEVLSPRDIIVRVIGFTPNHGVQVVVAPEQLVLYETEWRHRDGLVAFA